MSTRGTGGHGEQLGETILSMMRDDANVDLSEMKGRFRRYRFPPTEPHLAFRGPSKAASSAHLIGESGHHLVTTRRANQ